MPSNADANGVIVTAHFEPDEHEHEFVEVNDTRIEPTCLEYGTVKVKCTICGEVKEKELPALGHDYDKGRYHLAAPTRCGRGDDLHLPALRLHQNSAH